MFLINSVVVMVSQTEFSFGISPPDVHSFPNVFLTVFTVSVPLYYYLWALILGSLKRMRQTNSTNC